MKNLLPILALALVPLSLSAQTKPAVRKATTANHPVVTRTAITSAKKPVPAAKLTATQPSSAAPDRQEQPATAYVASRTQAVAAQPASRPTSRVAPVSTSASRFQVGFRLGVNSSTIGGVDISALGAGVKLARVMGFHGGVVFNIGGPSFSVQPEILYTQYGLNVTAGPDYYQEKYSLIEVPVLLKASFGQPNLRFFINAGPVGAYTMGGTQSVQEGGQSDSQKIDMTNQGRFSFGASGGAGVALQAGPGSVLLEARYSYLFSSSDTGAKLHPQNATLSVGYLIPVGGR